MMHGSFPKRYVLTLMALLATTLSIALQTNLSLTIVYMVKPSQDASHFTTPNECSEIRNISFNASNFSKRDDIDKKLDWSTEIQGYAIGFQFVGMIFGYVPGGRLGELYGAKDTMICSILLASVFTILTTIAARISPYVFIICRILVGLGTAPIFPIIVIMISKWIPESERSFISSIMLAGYGAGASVAYLAAGALCSSDFLGGWPSVFYLSGLVGVIWCVLCYFLVYESPEDHPTISLNELEYLQKSIGRPPKEV
ncbi:putative inorganic phosphate cotransporter [Trichonephila inaurata madagascariensis]|uniref:Putative inorganic phosphate cotransporter n=1 Tax=Trichonephila inaurata madagascariensis TaxID=2747483 RepID=A0A8X7CFG6_9ARAC|nr:putative inorganic phosphate cotransporter [Trichonephila inaurata madagascariensis]